MEFNINNSNQTQSFCSIANENHDLNSVSNCYLFFAKKNLYTTVLEIGLGLATVIVNCKLFWMILNKEEKFVFDKIYMAHIIVDFICGGIDLPIYHIFTTFEYWPFSMMFCVLWNTLDNSINTVSILHMVYLSWVRIESIRDPKGYLNKYIVIYPFTVSLIIWIIGLCLWFTVNYYFISKNYQYGQCNIPYNPVILKFILTFFTYFLPLIIIVLMTIKIIKVLHDRQKKKNKMIFKMRKSIYLTDNSFSINVTNQTDNVKKKFKLNAEAKMSIIIIVYLIQWVPSCILWMIDSLCNCIPSHLSTFTYWLTFSVSLTDAVIVMILNPNYSSNRLQKNTTASRI